MEALKDEWMKCLLDINAMKCWFWSKMGKYWLWNTVGYIDEVSRMMCSDETGAWVV